MKEKYIIATIKSWNIKNAKRLKKKTGRGEFVIISDKDRLTHDNVRKIDPIYIFFPHWSWMIPKEIYDNYECVVFHMTDLPFGRGGSPLQNLLGRGISDTKVTALKAVKATDAGPVYLKRILSLKAVLQRSSVKLLILFLKI